jgi:hypothetical protein
MRQRRTKPTASSPTSESSATNPIPHAAGSSLSPHSDVRDTKEKLELEKLRSEIEEKQRSTKWVVSAVRNVKLNEWVISAAALFALFGAWRTGLFDATRQHLAAQSERLTIQRIDLEQRRDKLTGEVLAKEQELQAIRKRLLRFEDEESAVKELRKAQSKFLDVRFSTDPAFEGLKISLRGRDQKLDWVFAPKTRANPYLSEALTKVNQVRSLKGLKLSEGKVSSSDLPLSCGQIPCTLRSERFIFWATSGSFRFSK